MAPVVQAELRDPAGPAVGLGTSLLAEVSTEPATV